MLLDEGFIGRSSCGDYALHAKSSVPRGPLFTGLARCHMGVHAGIPPLIEITCPVM